MKKKDINIHLPASHNWAYNKETKLYPCNRPGCKVIGEGFYDENKTFHIRIRKNQADKIPVDYQDRDDI